MVWTKTMPTDMLKYYAAQKKNPITNGQKAKVHNLQ